MTFPGVTSIIIVSRLTGEIFSGLTNTYLAESLNELKAAALAVLGGIHPQKKWFYRRLDLTLLKKELTAGIPQILYGSTWLLPSGQFVFYVGMTLFVLRRKKVEPLLKKTEKGV